MSANTAQNMRDLMPRTAKRIDALRTQHGADVVNAAIKQGMAGTAGAFFVAENGHTVGTPTPLIAGFVDQAKLLKMKVVVFEAADALMSIKNLTV